MRITDYEHSSHLRDVGIMLTRAEAEDLALYLSALLRRPELNAVHLSEVRQGQINREIQFHIQPELS